MGAICLGVFIAGFGDASLRTPPGVRVLATLVFKRIRDCNVSVINPLQWSRDMSQIREPVRNSYMRWETSNLPQQVCLFWARSCVPRCRSTVLRMR